MAQLTPGRMTDPENSPISRGTRDTSQLVMAHCTREGCTHTRRIHRDAFMYGPLCQECESPMIHESLEAP